MLTRREAITYFAKIFAVALLGAATLIVAGNWALKPFFDSQSTFVDGPPTYRFKLVQLRWLKNPDTWPRIETITRVALLSHIILVPIIWWACKTVKRRATNSKR